MILDVLNSAYINTRGYPLAQTSRRVVSLEYIPPQGFASIHDFMTFLLAFDSVVVVVQYLCYNVLFDWKVCFLISAIVKKLAPV